MAIKYFNFGACLLSHSNFEKSIKFHASQRIIALLFIYFHKNKFLFKLAHYQITRIL